MKPRTCIYHATGINSTCCILLNNLSCHNGKHNCTPIHNRTFFQFQQKTKIFLITSIMQIPFFHDLISISYQPVLNIPWCHHKLSPFLRFKNNSRPCVRIVIIASHIMIIPCSESHVLQFLIACLGAVK